MFCHRLFNDSWQRSFSHQCCEITLIRVLAPPDLEKLQALLSTNPKLQAAFEKYQTSTKAIDLVANLGFGGFNEKHVKEFPRICSDIFADRIDAGLTMDDVLNLLREGGLDSYNGKLPQQATLQLVSAGHELRGDRFVYRRFKTLGF